MKKPYTYLIGWPDHNLYYYGVRYKKGCCCSEFLVKYFTSSKLVHECMIKYGMPPLREIRKEFEQSKDAIEWEKKVLRRIKVLYNDKWLNKNISGAIEYDERIRQIISDSKRNRIWVHKQGKKTLIRKDLLKDFLSEGYFKGHGQKLLAENNPMFGKKHSSETKQKISNKNKINRLTEKGRIKKSIYTSLNNPMFNELIKNKHKIIMASLKVASKPVYHFYKRYNSIREANTDFPEIKYTTLCYQIKNKKNGWSFEPPI